ncbi:hypothetical protein SAMN05216421_1108 [Halopseudomonas xinjiangensis]|uniref:Uncharacterized protein n=1 Tax=Halopseudomonas xinjiangensis TaxID=487184 RepID=A0A1H1QCD5_9GAMM|nr:hypothetical protein [Halopseudomonas xinjiangensis]SDS21201.1 hypothetical protein SAMN05216421_1108 [Halopseudomonas xinjiangensis]
MSSRFSRAVGRLNSVAAARLADALGSYQHQSILVSNIPLQIDRGVSLEGAEGVFRASTVAITWPVSSLGAVDRGGLFILDGERFIVEDEIANDGQWITAACMEQR